MGVEAGPNIVNTGLVLSLDASNVRSFPGEPTTNLISNASTMPSWTSYSNGNDGTFTTEFGTTGYKMIHRGSWNGIYKNFNLVNSGTYTFSAWFRYWGGAANNNGATVYVSNYGGGDTASGLDKNLIGVWQRVTHTVSVTSPTNVYYYLISYGGTNGADYSSWDVTMPQIEAGSTATAFVDGTRSSTGGWKDLTTNNYHGDLANGPTYNSSNGGSIVFDGSNDTVNLPASSLTTTQNFTAEAWVKLSLRGDRHIVLVNWTGWAIEVGQGGSALYPYFTWWNGSAQLSTTWNLTATVGGWTHLCATFDGSTARIYVNGTQSAQYNSTTISYGVYARQISGTTFSGPILGNVASVRNYNVALTAAEVLQNFNATRARFGI